MAMVSTPRERRTFSTWHASWDDYERYRDHAIDLLMVLTMVGLAATLYLRPGDSSALRQDEWLVLAFSGLVLILSRLRRSIRSK
ncbi:hypothetical protein SAMN05444166_3665 [Singulisphaera sp. GP187]|uniref:hypothetical protein n=1 Tax=Singulisphaera sp. GP187 TaxID=1882752 RepID=UPI00092A7FA1|nr:hypothetical protein [Singulisphaera sp. GP187]SIO30844.1 hypothetical protein SAMN05444166_3665 [Singulisphaera sp. GP187]